MLLSVLLIVLALISCHKVTALRSPVASATGRALSRRARGCARRAMAPQDPKPTDKPSFDVAYFQGLLTEPVNSPASSSVDGQKRDNLTPNLKFIGIMAGVVGGLFGAFILANKDIPPPPY
jgi:hypothetical protein